MAAPTVVSLTADLVALTTRVVALENQVAAIAAEQAKRSTRIADLEAYAQENRAKIDQLDVSDQASGWRAWRDAKK